MTKVNSSVGEAVQRRQYYKALVDRDSRYDGVLFVGIRTTGIFCRPVCHARKPKMENCEFFKSAQEAILAGFRPCKKCRPMHLPEQTSVELEQLLAAIDCEPHRRWTTADLRSAGLVPETVRRKFQRHFGMTFVAYARARRMGLAFEQLRNKKSVIQAQQNSGYRSASGFRDAFAKTMGAPPKNCQHQNFLAEWIDTPLGPMVAIADDHSLRLLEFVDRRGLEREIERMRKKFSAAITPGKNWVLDSIRRDLSAYFAGKSFAFQTPIHLAGTPFQRRVWELLLEIPPGETRSYSQQATLLRQPQSVRAVARANGANQLAILVPCHRVLGADGSLTGYAGGLPRKQWLLDHESRHAAT